MEKREDMEEESRRRKRIGGEGKRGG